MSDGGVCRTALVTPGLLKSLHKSKPFRLESISKLPWGMALFVGLLSITINSLMTSWKGIMSPPYCFPDSNDYLRVPVEVEVELEIHNREEFSRLSFAKWN